jgi:hypothetical protein
MLDALLMSTLAYLYQILLSVLQATLHGYIYIYIYTGTHIYTKESWLNW